MNVLFICRGNAARSQMAEACYNSRVSGVHATSAGTLAKTQIPLPPDVIEALKSAGMYNERAHRKSLTKQMADEAEKIVLITNEYVPDYLIDNPKVIKWYVADPRGKGLSAQHKTLRTISAKVEELINTLGVN